MDTIPITHGTGTGPTELAAFDDAILKAGIGNYNLIYLSSIIPPGATPKVQKINWNKKEYGDRLYIVCAQQRTSTRGNIAAAGIGWVMSKERPARGMFVEHEGHSEEEVDTQITKTLQRMMKSRDSITWGRIQRKIVSIECKDEPVCALVAAVYQSQKWD